MKLIVGLGNPGKEYLKTRHNVGFLCIDDFISQFNTSFKKNNQFFCEIAQINEGIYKAIVIKPQTYMNLSGKAVKCVCDYYNISNEDTLVVYDDMDLNLGQLRIRYKGGSGGHNGIKSIIEYLGDDFKRIRVGISSNDLIEAKDYVLGKISKEENIVLQDLFKETKKALNDFIKGEDFQLIMTKYNIR